MKTSCECEINHVKEKNNKFLKFTFEDYVLISFLIASILGGFVISNVSFPEVLVTNPDNLSNNDKDMITRDAADDLWDTVHLPIFITQSVRDGIAVSGTVSIELRNSDGELRVFSLVEEDGTEFSVNLNQKIITGYIPL